MSISVLFATTGCERLLGGCSLLGGETRFVSNNGAPRVESVRNRQTNGKETIVCDNIVAALGGRRLVRQSIRLVGAVIKCQLSVCFETCPPMATHALN